MAMVENAKFWYACSQCREVKHYYAHEDGTTTFPRGEYLAHRDYLVAGFESEQAAKEWLKKQLAKEPLPFNPPRSLSKDKL